MAVSKDVLASLAIQLSLESASMKKDLTKISNSMNVFKSGLKALGGVIATTFSAYTIANFGKELVDLSGKLQGVKSAFETLDEPTLLQDLRVATRGTIDDLTLMQQAIRAENFRIPLDKLSTYLEFARRRAKATGEDIQYLVESLIVGLGRESPKIIDNLGISLLEVQEEVKKVGDFGTAVATIIEREMDKMGEDIYTVTEQTESLSTTWMNFKLLLADELTPAISGALSGLEDIVRVLGSDEISFLDKFLSATPTVIGSIRANKLSEELKTQEHIANLERDRLKWLDEINKTLTENVAVEKTVWDNLNRDIETYEVLWEKATSKEQLLEYGLKLDALREEKKQLEDIVELHKQKLELEKRQAALNQFLGGVTPMRAKTGGTGDLGIRNVETGTDDLDSMDQYLTNFYAKQKADAQSFHAEWGNTVSEIDNLNKMLEASFEDMTASLAYSLGEMAVTGKFNSGYILGSFANMAEQLGRLAIEMGMGTEAIKTSLESMNGYVAIAAGVALVALAGSVRAGMSSISNGGAASSVTMPQSYGTDNANFYRQFGQVDKQYLKVEVVGKIEGEDIRLANRRATIKHEAGY